MRRVVDDLGTALEVYGGLAITPNLKRLAAKGTQMRSAFVSIAVCAPSRTAFLVCTAKAVSRCCLPLLLLFTANVCVWGEFLLGGRAAV